MTIRCMMQQQGNERCELDGASLATTAPAAAGSRPISLLCQRFVAILFVPGQKLPRHSRTLCFTAIWMISSMYLAATAWHQQRALYPLLHDEFSYLLQAR